MAKLDKVTTKSSEQVWSTPDGKMTIFKIVLDYEGKEFEAKTYSKAISESGWSGEVETYEKQGKMGSETFVKQPQKEGGWQGGGRSFGGGKPQDPFTMYLSYAKDIVVAHITAQTKDGSKLGIVESIDAVIAEGNRLYEARPDAPSKEEAQNEAVDKVKQVFNDAEPVTEELPL